MRCQNGAKKSNKLKYRMQKQQFSAKFATKKHRKYEEIRYSNNVKVDVLLDQAVLLQSSSNLLVSFELSA